MPNPYEPYQNLLNVLDEAALQPRETVAFF